MFRRSGCISAGCRAMIASARSARRRSAPLALPLPTQSLPPPAKGYGARPSAYRICPGLDPEARRGESFEFHEGRIVQTALPVGPEPGKALTMSELGRARLLKCGLLAV